MRGCSRSRAAPIMLQDPFPVHLSMTVPDGWTDHGGPELTRDAGGHQPSIPSRRQPGGSLPGRSNRLGPSFDDLVSYLEALPNIDIVGDPIRHARWLSSGVPGVTGGRPSTSTVCWQPRSPMTALRGMDRRCRWRSPGDRGQLGFGTRRDRQIRGPADRRVDPDRRSVAVVFAASLPESDAEPDPESRRRSRPRPVPFRRTPDPGRSRSTTRVPSPRHCSSPRTTGCGSSGPRLRTWSQPAPPCR